MKKLNQLLLIFASLFSASILSAQQIDLSLTLVKSGFSLPVLVTHAGDGTDRLFVVEQRGRIRILDSSRNLLVANFLNLGSTGLNRVSQSGSERGLLGLAFHPDYETNGRFFVNYTLRSSNPGLDGDTIIAEYQVSPGDPNIASTTERIILGPINQPESNHNGGNLAFGPDGYLYIGMGDGGGGGDPNNNGQNKNSLLGKMLRIDVDSQPQPYTIPPDNPFAGAIPGADEIYAYGLRNPWRFSFDRLDGRLFCGDVGQDTYEEIDLIEKGDNLGWRIMEGFHCFPDDVACATAGLTLPIAEFGRSLGISVTGGHVYRGSQYPDMGGIYFFGDFGSGRVWSLEETAPGTWTRTERLNTPHQISSFGEDEAGEMYLVHYGGGAIYKMVDTSVAATPTPTLIPTPTSTQTPVPTPTVTSTPTQVPSSGISNWKVY